MWPTWRNAPDQSGGIEQTCEAERLVAWFGRIIPHSLNLTQAHAYGAGSSSQSCRRSSGSIYAPPIRIIRILFFFPGNRNNFASQKSCQNYCLSEACPPGTVVAKDGDSNRLVQCSNPGKRFVLEVSRVRETEGPFKKETCWLVEVVKAEFLVAVRMATRATRLHY